MEVSHLAEQSQILLRMHLGVELQQRRLEHVVVLAVNAGLPTTALGPYFLLMSRAAMAPLIGISLHEELVRRLLAFASGATAPEPFEHLESGIKRELVQRLEDALEPFHIAGEEEEEEFVTPIKKSRTKESLDTFRATLTEQVRQFIKNNTPISRQVETIVDASLLIQQATGRDDASETLHLEEKLGGRKAMATHLMHVDSALDGFLGSYFLDQRKTHLDMFGIGLATDESPPSQARFGGMRFQVTTVYWPEWEPETRWDASLTPPLVVCSRLLDIVNCPGKDGRAVMAILDKQLERVGLSRLDVVCGVGDGGGENEARFNGIHATLEESVPGYVRRRCLGHLAWRVADACLSVMPGYARIRKLCEYLGDGCTWQRLQSLATTGVLEGGLGLCTMGSREHKRVFGRAPGSIVEGRPESDLNFLRFLRGREHALHLVTKEDLARRPNLAQATHDAVPLLGDHEGRAMRQVCAEVLHRALYLHWWVNKHGRIAETTRWPYCIFSVSHSFAFSL